MSEEWEQVEPGWWNKRTWAGGNEVDVDAYAEPDGLLVEISNPLNHHQAEPVVPWHVVRDLLRQHEEGQQ